MLHATVRPGATVSRRPQLQVHTSRRFPPTEDVDGVLAATPAAAWIQLGAQLHVDDLVVVADALMRRTDPLLQPTDLADAVAACPARTRGIRRLRDALDLTRPGTDSLMETRCRLVLVRSGLPCPVVNSPVLGPGGRFLARPDLQYPELKIAIEYDGDIHRTDPATWRRDVERRQRMEDAGWLIVTATADDVLRFPERLVSRLTRHRRSRTPTHP